jgi:hypothetical protein
MVYIKWNQTSQNATLLKTGDVKKLCRVLKSDRITSFEYSSIKISNMDIK